MISPSPLHPFTSHRRRRSFADSILVVGGPCVADLLKTSSGENFNFCREFPETQLWGSAVERCQGKVGILHPTYCSSNQIAKRYEGQKEGRVDLTTCGALFAAAPVIQKRLTPELTYKFDDDFPDAAKPAMLRAFASWEEPLNFTFSFCFEGEADIYIGMYKGEHGDQHPFKAGPGGELAHASYPPHGEVHFNREQPWWYDLDPSAAGSELFFDFQSAAVHEIGHLLGVEHNDYNRNSVMYESIDLGEIRRGLTIPDVDALQHIYAGDPNFD